MSAYRIEQQDGPDVQWAVYSAVTGTLICTVADIALVAAVFMAGVRRCEQEAA